MIANLFRRTKSAVQMETKSSPPLIALSLAGAPRWSGRDFANMARNGIMRNAIVYRCIEMIAEAAASVPWLLYEDDREIDDHPLLTLLKKPNPYENGVQLFTRWYAFLAGAGNAYLHASRIGASPRELNILRPDRVCVVTDAHGCPVAYDYTGGNRSVRYGLDSTGFSSVLHGKLFHPLDDIYGLSPMEAAGAAIDIHNAAEGWTKSLLDNAARPSGALIYKGADGYSTLTDDQFQRLKSELENTYQGAVNAGRPMILEGGLEWRSMSYSPSDMNFSEIRNAAAREIALAFGVPTMLLGIPGDNTYSTYREANVNFWRQTVLPLVRHTASALTSWMSPCFAEPLRVDCNTDTIEALVEERESDWQRIDGASFLTVNEKRVAAGYSPLDIGDTIS